MRTGFQALLGSTALAGAIAVAALMSSGSARVANADVITDAVKATLASMMQTQGAAIPEATRTAVGVALNSTTDGAELMDRLNSLATQNAALAETIGAALGKASLSLQLSDARAAASQVSAFVSTTSNAKLAAGYSAATTPITAATLPQSAAGRQVAQATPTEIIQQQIDLTQQIIGINDQFFSLGDIQTSFGTNNVVFLGQTYIARTFQYNIGTAFNNAANNVARAIKIGPYSTSS